MSFVGRADAGGPSPAGQSVYAGGGVPHHGLRSAGAASDPALFLSVSERIAALECSPRRCGDEERPMTRILSYSVERDIPSSSAAPFLPDTLPPVSRSMVRIYCFSSSCALGSSANMARITSSTLSGRGVSSGPAIIAVRGSGQGAAEAFAVEGKYRPPALRQNKRPRHDVPEFADVAGPSVGAQLNASAGAIRGTGRPLRRENSFR